MYFWSCAWHICLPNVIPLLFAAEPQQRSNLELSSYSRAFSTKYQGCWSSIISLTILLTGVIFLRAGTVETLRFFIHAPQKLWGSETVSANRVAAINPPIDDTDPIRNFSIDPGSHTDWQNPAEFSPKGRPIRNFSIDPTSSIRTSIADAIFADAISETPKSAAICSTILWRFLCETCSKLAICTSRFENSACFFCFSVITALLGR